MQCKDIPDRPILEMLAGLPPLTIGAGTHDLTPREDYPPTVRDAMPPNTPDRLMLAKMRQLMHRGLVDGCCCGCRGDFTITEKGRDALTSRNPAPPPE